VNANDGLYADDRERRKSQTEKTKAARDRALDDVARIAATPEGLRFFRRFLALGRFNEPTFRGNNFGEASFLEGRQSMANQIFTDILAACPERLQQLLTEEEP
jgi:hypothetical protein